MKWNFLESIEQIDVIRNLSHKKPILIFKHSTRCSISTIALHRLDSDWSILNRKVEPFFLDLIANRDISDAIANAFSVAHESPQVLLLRSGECTFESSHLDIQADEIHEALSYKVF
ncbi:MAG: bacillithiol system redox-active protein YtxJ [Bacteroidia bacterium]|nr:bacillithiol system redox-active protein YtxJ [Bacteroidia bacterium]